MTINGNRLSVPGRRLLAEGGRYGYFTHSLVAFEFLKGFDKFLQKRGLCALWIGLPQSIESHDSEEVVLGSRVRLDGALGYEGTGDRGAPLVSNASLGENGHCSSGGYVLAWIARSWRLYSQREIKIRLQVDI